MFKVGDKIKIIDVDPAAKMSDYIGRSGIIERISTDPWGSVCLYGTWGGCSLHAGEDVIEIITEENC